MVGGARDGRVGGTTGEQSRAGDGFGNSSVWLEARDERTEEVCCSGEGSARDGDDAEQELKRANRTGGWKEERFERGLANCRGDLTVV